MGIFNLFRKKEQEKSEFPYHYAQIIWNESALHSGTLDDYNKEIQRIKNGKIVERIPFTEADAISIVESYNIPIFDYTKMKGDKFNFEESMSLTGTFIENV